jgi:hypothetical protein
VVSYRARDTNSELERQVQLVEADKRLAIPYVGFNYEDNVPEGTCYYDEDGQFRFECVVNYNSPRDVPNRCCDVAR